MTEVDPSISVVLVKGDDETLVGEQVSRVVDGLLGGEERSLALDEFTIDDLALEEGGYSMASFLDALSTPPFLSERRVVLVRHAGVFSTKDSVAPLVAALAESVAPNALVLAWEKDPRPGRAARNSAVPRSLLDAIDATGGAVVDVSTGRRVDTWIDDRLAEDPLALDPAARRAIVDHLGTEAGRLPALLETLHSVFGADARLSADEVAPYLGTVGDVVPWELTDAIDAGDVTRSLSVLQRMLEGGGRHPLQVLATLVNHYVRLARLDDPGIGGEKAAAELLGMKGSTFPARKALEGARRLGSDRIAEILELLAQADLDLRGTKVWPPELVVEVLVARVAGRNRSSSRRSAGSARR